MTIVVQKYGGSSVGTTEKIKRIAERVVGNVKEGKQVVVVVSAMGDTTDDLITLTKEITKNPARRELDFIISTGEQVSAGLLALAVQELGQKCVALSGWQAGFITDGTFSNARILSINPTRVHRHLEDGEVVIVTGFQGITEMSKDGDVTTLGRGGSDTSAVALAAALKSDVCEIYTDVDGVYTADPNKIDGAKKLDTIGYEEMLELAGVGAKVMHPRAVELGSLYGITIEVRNSHNNNPGTRIIKENTMENDNRVSGIAVETDIGVITLLHLPDRPGIAAEVFEHLANIGIATDIIVQATSSTGEADLSFTLPEAELERAKEALEAAEQQIQAKQIISRDDLGKISIVGTGVKNDPTYASRMFKILAEQGINIHMIGSSNIRITCVIDKIKIPHAMQLLHNAFVLEKVK